MWAVVSYTINIRELDFINPKPFRVFKTDDTSLEIDDIVDRVTYEVVIESSEGISRFQVHLGNGHGGDEPPPPPPPKKKLALILSWASKGTGAILTGAKLVEVVEKVVHWTSSGG